MELTIDTSSDTAGVVLSHKGETLIALTWHTARNHTTELLPNLACVLQQGKVEMDCLDAITVATGPGSFNGLRVGISTAKGLAYALNAPLLGVNTLEAEAFPFAFTGFPLRPVHRAGREEIATALYREEDGRWQCLEEPHLTTLPALCRGIRRKTLLCGEIPPDMAEQIRQSAGSRALVPADGGLCRAGALAALGWRRLSNGERDDPVTLQPLYLRPPHITRPRDRKPPFTGVGRAREAPK